MLVCLVAYVVDKIDISALIMLKSVFNEGAVCPLIVCVVMFEFEWVTKVSPAGQQ